MFHNIHSSIVYNSLEYGSSLDHLQDLDQEDGVHTNHRQLLALRKDDMKPFSTNEGI